MSEKIFLFIAGMIMFIIGIVVLLIARKKYISAHQKSSSEIPELFLYLIFITYGLWLMAYSLNIQILHTSSMGLDKSFPMINI